jgi:tRNA 2-thiocytidine biosynthesis protein TtcA
MQALEKKLLHYMSKAVHDFNMIPKGTRVMVCVSGGKDSMTMLYLLNKMRIASHYHFDLLSFTLDQVQPGWNDDLLRAWLQAQNIPYEILSEDTYSIVTDKIPANKTYCSLCSRLRRGIIYRYAKDHGLTHIALGHHRDDTIVTLLMSMMFNGQIKAMPPKLLTDDQQHLVIRPMIYCQEKDIEAYAKAMAFPIIPCTLCGSQSNLQRAQIKAMIATWSQKNPKIPSNLLHATQSLQPSQLMDENHWDFKGLNVSEPPSTGSGEGL